MDYKKDFPIFTNQVKPFYYLDSAATSHKPGRVIDAVADFYRQSLSPVHRSPYPLAEKATNAFEGVRKKVQAFINAQSEHEIIFTKNTNEGINLIANDCRDNLTKTDIVVLSKMEHHANIVPWLKLQEEIGFTIEWLDFDKEYRLAYKDIFLRGFSHTNIKIVSLTHTSNVLGTINPIREIIKYYKQEGITATFIVDGAQAIPHMKVDVQDLDCDYYVFSAHKMLGPSGVGVLYGKQEQLDKTIPLLWGSHMIDWVTQDTFEVQEDEQGYEAGTPNIEGVIGLGAAIDYFNTLDFETFTNYEQQLTAYALEALQKIKGLTLYGPQTNSNRVGVLSFTVGEIHAHDLAEIISRRGVCIRAGHHCAQPLMARLGLQPAFAVARASLYLYNTKNDIDELVKGITTAKKVLRV